MGSGGAAPGRDSRPPAGRRVAHDHPSARRADPPWDAGPPTPADGAGGRGGSSMAIETADEMQRVEGARCFQTHGADAGRRPHEHLRLPARRGRTDLPGHPAPHAVRHHVPGGPGDHRPDPRAGCPTRPRRCSARSCGAGRRSPGTATPPCTRTAGAATAPRARTTSTATTPPTATTRSSGSPPSPGRTSRSACPAPRPGPRPRSPRRPPPPQRQGVLHPGRRVEHLRRRRLRGQLHRDGATVAVGVQQHPGPVGNASSGRDGADRVQRRAARRASPVRPATATRPSTAPATAGRPTSTARSGCTSR